MADFPAVVDLRRLGGSNGFGLVGIDRGDPSGEFVASAGYVNGAA